MKIRPFLSAITVALLFFVSISSPVYAARIYNKIDSTLGAGGYTSVLDGSASGFVTLPPNSKSGSLDWDSNATFIKVMRESGAPYCSIDCGNNNEIQGGNYMIIESFGNCFICDSDHELLEGTGDC